MTCGVGTQQTVTKRVSLVGERDNMIKVLKYAAGHCLCEGPYNQSCQKCKGFTGIMQEKAAEFARAKDENLVYVDNYNHMVLLPRGDLILQYSRGNYAAPEESED